MSKRALARLIIAGVVLFVMAAYEAAFAGPKAVFHSFGYGGYRENEGIEILDYQYGNSKVPVTRAEKGSLPGHIAQGNGVAGELPVGEALYVKWRVTATGKEYQDTVVLKGRLPSDMERKIVHFAVMDTQLSVFVIDGNSSKELHDKKAPDCPLLTYGMFRCSRIYPDHWKNF
jgi:hypothetical protein